MPGHDPTDDAGGRLVHEPRLGRGQLLAADAAAGVVQHQDDGNEHQGRGYHADEPAHLHLPGRAAQQVSHLPVLEHVPGHAGHATHHRGHAQYGDDPRGALHAEKHQQPRRQQQSRQRQSGDGVGRGADDAHQVPRHGCEEEPRDGHDDGGHNGHPYNSGEPVVDGGHAHHQHADEGQNLAEAEVLLRARHLALVRTASQRAEGAGHAADEVLAHLEQGVEGAHDHGPDGHVLDGVAVDGAEHAAVPEEVVDAGDLVGLERSAREVGGQPLGGHVVLGLLPQVLVLARTGHEHQNQRHEKQPAKDAAGEGDGGELGPDDVAHAQEGRRGRWGYEGEGGAGGLGRSTHGEQSFHLRGDERDAVAVFEQLDESRQAHGAEDQTGARGAPLSGLDDLGAGHGLREGQRGVLHEGPAEQDHEEHPQDAAHQQQRGTLQVVHQAEVRP